MAQQPNPDRKQLAYVAGYCGLLLISVSGLILQGGLWMLTGLAAWTAIVVVLVWCIIHYNYPYHAKDLKQNSTRRKGYLGEKEGKSIVAN